MATGQAKFLFAIILRAHQWPLLMEGSRPTVLAFQYPEAPGKHTQHLREETHKTDILLFFRHHV